ncbi:helix-turn-helix transcriptional regulator [Clostridium sp. C8-1-8]|uniref:helix-turn-helix domain-containing protein n=1 Tax=Clostridium sp. C8-1-8 TaxID=2698831 RepID=UPI001FACD630|nr:helix-turn-helix transcriptional regulator [Clostridium sp. C8-1-8]
MNSKVQIENRDQLKDKYENKTSQTLNDLNKIKFIKNTLYDDISNVFIYNLKKLIQLEGTQKKLAKKIGVSEDLLSKYKSGDAFPSIETLVYICKVYNLKLDIFISQNISAMDLENIEKGLSLEVHMFDKQYYCYFLSTNISKEGAIHEGLIEIEEDKAFFKIMSRNSIMKSFSGNINTTEKLLSFDLHSSEDGICYINMIKPNVNKDKYMGGLSLLFLPSDANSKPCCQKLLFSKKRIDRTAHYESLKNILSFQLDTNNFGNIKLSSYEDEKAYNFIEQLD